MSALKEQCHSVDLPWNALEEFKQHRVYVHEALLSTVIQTQQRRETRKISGTREEKRAKVKLSAKITDIWTT